MLSIYETEKRRYAEDMLPHYLECASWSDMPEDVESGLDFDAATEEMALADCMRFCGMSWDIIENCRPDQVGHDLWLTRNHHGTGFWDRPEIYGGQVNAEKLTDIAQKFREVSVYEHNGKLIIE
jgi:hypothetical protein